VAEANVRGRKGGAKAAARSAAQGPGASTGAASLVVEHAEAIFGACLRHNPSKGQSRRIHDTSAIRIIDAVELHAAAARRLRVIGMAGAGMKKGDPLGRLWLWCSGGRSIVALGVVRLAVA